MLQIALIEKRSAALPGQRGHLPCLVLRKQSGKRVASLRVLGREQELQIAFAFDEFILFCRTAFENTHQVLDTFLPSLDNFLDANLVRHMPDDGQALFVSFRCSGKIGVVRDDGLNFDEVHALLLH